MADYFRASLSDGRSPSPSTPRTPLTPSTPGSRSNNALTAKVNSVLSASYADLEIKDALALLDEREVRNTAETRRRLRLDIQKDVIDTNGAVIKEFGTVAEQLKRIGATLASLTASYAEMKKHVTLANQETAPVLEEAKDLLERKEDGEKKSQLLEAFRKHFLMSEDDQATLTSTAEPVDLRFFEILNRAKTIQKDCTVLLTDEQHQRLGTEIHERTSQSIDRAFEKLHRWTTREFKNLNLENPSLNSSMRTALKVLAERPSLFQSCLDAFAEAREKTLADLFYAALTGYNTSGIRQEGGKAIEEEAHDAMRYVGDMAAWVHSATVSEREALETLFLDEGEELSANIKRGREIEVSYSSDSDDEDEDISPGTAKHHAEKKEETVFDGRKALNQLVDRDISTATRTLRQRIEQVLSSIEDPVLSYKISHLLGFYHITFLKLFGSQSQQKADSFLVTTISDLQFKAFERFEKLAQDAYATLQESQDAADDIALHNDLGVPDWLSAALSQLTEIFKTFDSSLSLASSPPAVSDAELSAVLHVCWTPYVTLLGQHVASIPRGSAKGFIFHLNSLEALKTCLSRSSCSHRFFESGSASAGEFNKIIDSINSTRNDLEEWVYEYLAKGSGCADLLKLITEYHERSGKGKNGKEQELREDYTTLQKNQSFSPENLETAAQSLDAFLPSALMDVLDELRQLSDESLKREVVDDAVEKFCTAFEWLEDALGEMSVPEEDEEERMDGDDSEDELARGRRRYFPRTSGEIRVLLS